MNSEPVTGKYRIIPLIEQRATEHVRPFEAEAETQLALGFPAQLVDDWQAKAIARLGELVAGNRGLKVFFDTCTKCGACTDKCHYFLGTRDPKNMPVARQDLMRSVYRRYFTFSGKWFPWLVGARDLTEDMLQDWYRYYHQCSECRRCTVFCPQGIDTSEVTMAGREILASVGLGQQYTTTIIDKVHRTGNNLGLKPAALADILASLEEDILDDTGVAVRLPLDDPEADMLVVTPSADFFAEPHVDGLIGYAKVLHQAGIRWTFSTQASEAANFGLFNGSREHMQRIAERVRQAALSLGTRRVVIGECGHAWRVAYSFFDTLIGDPEGNAEGNPEGNSESNSGRSSVGLAGFLEPSHPRAEHICEVTHALWQAGRITLDPTRNAGRVVTFHDSCNVARGAGMGGVAGGQFEIPRDLLRASCEQFVEMSADTTRQQTFCCGGGGGMLADELTEVRIKGALPRAEALQRVVDSDAVTHLAAICAICKTQLAGVLPAHDLAGVEIVSLHQLVGDALVLDGER